VRRIDLRADSPESRTVRVAGRPDRIVRAGGALWVTDIEDEAVTRIHSDSARPVGRPLAVGEDPAGLDVALGAAWVTSKVEDTVTRVRMRRP
jgi:DNA-binding beta-propeller fold protein YncE